jgi:hypothetical protein
MCKPVESIAFYLEAMRAQVGVILLLCGACGSRTQAREPPLKPTDVAVRRPIAPAEEAHCRDVDVGGPDRERAIDGFVADRPEEAISGLIRRADGAIEQRSPLSSGPQDISLRGRRVHVESYAHVADFDIDP